MVNDNKRAGEYKAIDKREVFEEIHGNLCPKYNKRQQKWLRILESVLLSVLETVFDQQSLSFLVFIFLGYS